MRRLFPLFLLAAMPVWAQQQQPGNLQPLPAILPPPPGMDAFDEALEPQVTIVKDERETREEFRANGCLYMVKVTPAVGPAYSLVDQQGDGNFVQRDTIGAGRSSADVDCALLVILVGLHDRHA